MARPKTITEDRVIFSTRIPSDLYWQLKQTALDRRLGIGELAIEYLKAGIERQGNNQQ